jgi:AbrB family looped-hinge helix DNA binding protein
MTTTIVTVKGQVVIPSKIRRRLNIKKGTRLCIIERDNEIVLKPMTAEYFERTAGALKGGRGVRALIREREKEKRAEEGR